APRCTIAVGRGYAPDALVAPRRTIRRTPPTCSSPRAARRAVGRGYAPDALFARAARRAVGRGYVPDLLFAAIRRAGFVRLPFRRHQDQELSRRDGASHLSLLVQRNLAQRKHTPPTRPTLRVGFAEPAGFSERASCPRGKRRTSMCGALRVLSAGSAATEGPRRSRSRSTATATASTRVRRRSGLRPRRALRPAPHDSP